MSRRLAALPGLVALAAVSVPLAAPGPRLVPGAVEGGPGWLMGLSGGGFGLGGAAYLALLGVAFACYLAVLAGAAVLPRRALWAAIVALVALFVLAPPLLSRDVFSYIAYARLGAEHGLNPYAVVPADLPADQVLAHVGWRDAVSAYGPLFTLASYPLGLVGVPAALWVLKCAAGLAVLGTAALAARVAGTRGLDPGAAAALVALNPLVLVHVVGGAHNDGLMMLAAMAAVAALGVGREAAGGGWLALAAAVKVSGSFLAPFALLGAGRRRRLLAGAAIAAAVVGAAALAAFGTEVAGSLGLAGENQALTSRYSVPSTLARIGGLDVEALRIGALTAYGVLVAWLLVWTARGGDWLRAAGWAGFGLLLATGWLLPWYVVWALPLAAVAGDRRLTGAVLALCAFQLVNRVPL